MFLSELHQRLMASPELKDSSSPVKKRRPAGEESIIQEVPSVQVKKIIYGIKQPTNQLNSIFTSYR